MRSTYIFQDLDCFRPLHQSVGDGSQIISSPAVEPLWILEDTRDVSLSHQIVSIIASLPRVYESQGVDIGAKDVLRVWHVSLMSATQHTRTSGIHVST